MNLQVYSTITDRTKQESHRLKIYKRKSSYSGQPPASGHAVRTPAKYTGQRSFRASFLPVYDGHQPLRDEWLLFIIPDTVVFVAECVVRRCGPNGWAGSN